jgi:single-stranded-DNA-specific exonuclease
LTVASTQNVDSFCGKPQCCLVNTDIDSLSHALSIKRFGSADRLSLSGIHGESFIDHRIRSADSSCGPVAIVSDYDCDGVCSAALLARWYMNGPKIKPSIIFPNRMVDGYGLSAGVASRIPEGTRKVWVLDCGTSSLDVLKEMDAKGLDVTVIDHHLYHGEIPDNVWNPGASEGLCTAALVYRMLYGTAVNRHIHLAALATMTDVCSLRHIQNWTMVREAMAASIVHKGILGLTGGSHVFSESAAGFHIGPIINAAGRISDPMTAFRLMVNSSHTDDSITKALVDINQERKDMTQKFFDLGKEALENAKFQSCAVVVIEQCHPGIVGIVASRLADLIRMPAIVLCAHQGQYVGSGRSRSGVDLHQAVGKCSHLLARFGGHSEAIGMAIEPGNLDQFVEDIQAHCHRQASGEFSTFDFECSLSQLPRDAFDQLQPLRPWGKDNREPLFRIPVKVKGPVRRSSNGEHSFFSVYDPALPGPASEWSAVAWKTKEVSTDAFLGTFRIDRYEGGRGGPRDQLVLVRAQTLED